MSYPITFPHLPNKSMDGNIPQQKFPTGVLQPIWGCSSSSKWICNHNYRASTTVGNTVSQLAGVLNPRVNPSIPLVIVGSTIPDSILIMSRGYPRYDLIKNHSEMDIPSLNPHHSYCQLVIFPLDSIKSPCCPLGSDILTLYSTV